MMSEKESKIRKLLGNEYHLCSHYEGLNLEKWYLFKKYKNPKIYFNDINKPVMTSENNTIDDLYEFAKKHHKIDVTKSILMVNTIICFVSMIVLALNIIFFNNDFIRYFILGIDIAIIIIDIVIYKVNNHNFDVDMLEYKEMLRDINENKDNWFI